MLATPVKEHAEMFILKDLSASLLTFIQESSQTTIVRYWKKYKTHTCIHEDTETNSKIFVLEQQLEEALKEIDELKVLAETRKNWEEKYWFLRSVTSDAILLLNERMHNSCGGDEDEYDVLEKRLDWIDNN